MAQQTKAEDPIAAAMSAIEDALNLSHGDAGVEVARAPRPGQPPQAKAQPMLRTTQSPSPAASPPKSRSRAPAPGGAGRARR